MTEADATIDRQHGEGDDDTVGQHDDNDDDGGECYLELETSASAQKIERLSARPQTQDIFRCT